MAPIWEKFGRFGARFEILRILAPNLKFWEFWRQIRNFEIFGAKSVVVNLNISGAQFCVDNFGGKFKISKVLAASFGAEFECWAFWRQIVLAGNLNFLGAKFEFLRNFTAKLENLTIQAGNSRAKFKNFEDFGAKFEILIESSGKFEIVDHFWREILPRIMKIGNWCSGKFEFGHDFWRQIIETFGAKLKFEIVDHFGGKGRRQIWISP